MGMLSGAIEGMAKGVDEVAKMSWEDMAAKRRDESKARREAAGLKARKDIADADRASREKIAEGKAKADKDNADTYTTTTTNEDLSKTQNRYKNGKRVVPSDEKDRYNLKQRKSFKAALDRVPESVDPKNKSRYAYDSIMKSPTAPTDLQFDTYDAIMSEYGTKDVGSEVR